MNKVYAAAPEEDIVLSSRVRLARNYNDIPFSPKMTSDQSQETIRRAATRIAESDQANFYRLYYLSSLSENERRRMLEKQFISNDLLSNAENAAVLISVGETVSIMLNEEDHLRILGLLPGEQLDKAAQLAFQADDLLGGGETFAFDPKWGYLTACPTNAGTGMRASVQMHLPALAHARKMSPVAQAAGKLGFTLRGMYGDNGESEGNIFQLSNQATMGRTEEDVLKNLIAVCAQIADQEREERKREIELDADSFADKMMRSVGILLNARLLDLKEFMRLYSDLRFAAGVGLLAAPIAGIDEMMRLVQPGALEELAGAPLSERDSLLLRASEVRSRLSTLIDDK